MADFEERTSNCEHEWGKPRFSGGVVCNKCRLFDPDGGN